MSTDHQRYSTENQSDAIETFALANNMTVVRRYLDEGKSGLSTDGRQGFEQLIADVTNGAADFEVILVLDVSRWGRFQDTDESATYEYICRKKGIKVLYCAEQFANDGSTVTTIVKNMKRAMAAMYSHDLSNKVFTGQCRLTFESVGLLGAIIAIRTFLSFSLETEIEGCWPWQRANRRLGEDGDGER